MSMNVTWQKPEYVEWLPKAELVVDVCENKVKSKKEIYLPKPNKSDLSEENNERYKAYLERAILYGFTRHHLAGMVGKAFQDAPEVTRPEGLAYIDDDVDGMGNSITQQAQRTFRGILTKGRHCLLVDYPEVEGVPTRREQEENYIRPTILSIDATRVINWRTEKIGAIDQLTLVVYRDDAITVSEDGFEEEKVEQYRVLRLINGVYGVEVVRKQKTKVGEEWVVIKSNIPVDANGNFLPEIPMVFVGATNNDVIIDEIPLYDIAVLNIGHYRNSADYEKNAFTISNPQPWANGVDEQWLNDQGGVVVGCDKLIALPEVSSRFEIAQVKPNMVAKEAMVHKEKEMTAIGATLIQPDLPVRTATQAAQEHQAQHSIISLSAANVSDAYNRCLEWMKLFSGVDGDTNFEIQANFLELLAEPLPTAKINRDYSNETIGDSNEGE